MTTRDTNRPSAKSEPRSHRVWLVVLLCLALLLAVPVFFALRWFRATSNPSSSPAREPVIIASFRADFRPENPTNGWHYYWNANGAVGDTIGYTNLVWNGTLYATVASPLPAPSPARYLRLSRTGGHPGQGPSQTASRGIHDEFAVIVGFSVTESGSYTLGQSFISRHAGPKGGNVHLQVFINDRETGAEIYCRSREPVAFDRALGKLAAGDTICVTIGAGETDVDDSFDLDFSIGRL